MKKRLWLAHFLKNMRKTHLAAHSVCGVSQDGCDCGIAVTEEPFVHDGTIPLFQLSSERLCLCCEVCRETRKLRIFKIGKNRLTQ